ncbi:MAG TPA: BACON domain-containing carbohydrate-binding protein [Vicinamibacterales bacterium]|nr:BACON domain-containing carbohydrate-binding protein [Vicinamibacterales bacterium]
MLDSSRRLFVMLVAIAAMTIACGHKTEQPTTPTSPTPTTPTTPSPAPPDPAPTPPQPTTCTYAAATEPDDYDRDGGNGVLRITTAAGCHWTVKADASWASIEGAVEGDGPATLKVFVRANEDALARRMTFTVQDKTASVSQPGQGDCEYQVSPVLASIPRDRWNGTIAISTSRGCRWTAASAAPWLRLAAGGGSGSGTLGYDAEFNPDTSYAGQRLAVVEIRWIAPTAGQNVRVNQWGSCGNVASPATGGLPAGATFSGGVGGGSLTVGADGGRVHLWVLSEPFMGCAWTMESSDSWLSWESPRLHQVNSGDGDTFFTVPSNSSSSQRTASATIGGWPLTIVQKGR